MFVIPFFGDYFLTPEVIGLYAILFIAHFLALIETFVFVGKIDVKPIFVVVAIIWLVMHDFVDYFLGTHPTLPSMDAGQFSMLIGVTVGLSLICSIGYFLLLKSKFRFFSKLVFD